MEPYADLLDAATRATSTSVPRPVSSNSAPCTQCSAVTGPQKPCLSKRIASRAASVDIAMVRARFFVGCSDSDLIHAAPCCAGRQGAQCQQEHEDMRGEGSHSQPPVSRFASLMVSRAQKSMEGYRVTWTRAREGERASGTSEGERASGASGTRNFRAHSAPTHQGRERQGRKMGFALRHSCAQRLGESSTQQALNHQHLKHGMNNLACTCEEKETNFKLHARMEPPENSTSVPPHTYELNLKTKVYKT